MKEGGMPQSKTSVLCQKGGYALVWDISTMSERGVCPNLGVDPAFRLMRFPLDGELDFYFEKLIFIDYLKMTWSRHLFLFYF